MPKTIIRINCDVEGYEDFWIDYDVTGWGIDIATSVPYTARFSLLRNFIPKHSVNWYVKSDDGAAIKHPGPGKTDILWQSIWKQLGPKTGQALALWFCMSAYSAVGEWLDPSPKSETNGETDSAGSED
jgi:hypothetical protein